MQLMSLTYALTPGPPFSVCKIENMGVAWGWGYNIYKYEKLQLILMAISKTHARCLPKLELCREHITCAAWLIENTMSCYSYFRA